MNFEKAIAHILHRLEEGLPESLQYHSLEHTQDVMKACEYIAKAEGIKGQDMDILMTAAAYHDSGFLQTYADHEEASCEIAAESLPEFGFDAKTIKLIQDMIMSTRVPQASEIHLGRILCDADLDYLGGDNYYKVSRGLYAELLLNGFEIDDEKWLDLQINFLENHQFWTDFSIRERSSQKDEVLAQLLSERAELN